MTESQHFSMFQTFSMFFSERHRKMLGKSLGHRKMSVLVFFTNTKFKKTRQKWLSPNIFLCCFEKNIKKIWDIEKCWDSVIFLLHFSEFGYVTKIFYVPNFFYVFRWTHLLCCSPFKNYESRSYIAPCQFLVRTYIMEPMYL